jgi:hypothetical protein
VISPTTGLTGDAEGVAEVVNVGSIHGG